MRPEARYEAMQPSSRGQAGGGGFSNLIISDTFTAADATNPNGRTPSPVSNGNTWSVIKQTFDINSNQLRQTTASDGLIQINPAATNYQVEFDFITPGTIDAASWAGVIVRLTQNNAVTGTIVYYDRATASYIIGGQGENVTPVYASVAGVVNPSTTYHWKIVCVADVVSLYVDGVLKVTASGTTTAAQYVSIIETHSANSFRYDNFQVFT